MTDIKIYQVDSFTNEAFKGNPAGVCILDSWLDDQTMQNIAAEMNLAETAFAVASGKEFDLRWFTPVAEVRLCGHATLATAHILYQKYNVSNKSISFNTKSGVLKVAKSNDKYDMEFPSDSPAIAENELIQDALNSKVLELYKGKDDYLAILESEDVLIEEKPNLSILKKLEGRGLIISAPGNNIDFVSRCFYPNLGINEDPVTGSAHTLLTPYWAVKLNKNILEAAQLSPRGGTLTCSLSSNKIILSGQAITTLEGKLILP